MRILLAIILPFVFASSSVAAGFQPYEGPQPIAVFIQFDPWAMVLGADTPRVAIYESGEAIFAKKRDGRLVYQQANLSVDAMAEVAQRIEQVLARTDINQWYNVAGDITDQPEAMIYLSAGDRELVTRVYGLAAPDTTGDPVTSTAEQTPPADPLDHLFQLHAWFSRFSVAESEEWIPRYVEVMFWDYSYAPEPSIHWPADWPSFDSERSTGHAQIRSVFLDGDQLPALRQFLATRNEKGAVEVDGKKWAVSYRYTFPSEPVWKEAFARINPVDFQTPAMSFVEKAGPRTSWLTIFTTVAIVLLAILLSLLIHSRRRRQHQAT